MLVLHNEIYNPKIDYLICKQLIKTLPIDYDEDKIRGCYKNYLQAMEICEKDLINIKSFFEENNILQITNDMIENLYQLCAHQDIHIDVDITTIIQSDLYAIATFVNETSCQRNCLFQILFLIYYCMKNNSPIIPYLHLCNKIFYAIIAQEESVVTSLFEKLQNHTQKYMIKHSLSDGELCVRLLYENKNLFLAEVGAIGIGYYGSYARGNENEYSDFDILAVFSDEKSLPLCKRRSLEFWGRIMPIEIDVAVINQCNVEFLPKGIMRSVKFI